MAVDTGSSALVVDVLFIESVELNDVKDGTSDNCLEIIIVRRELGFSSLPFNWVDCTSERPTTEAWIDRFIMGVAAVEKYGGGTISKSSLTWTVVEVLFLKGERMTKCSTADLRL